MDVCRSVRAGGADAARAGAAACRRWEASVLAVPALGQQALRGQDVDASPTRLHCQNVLRQLGRRDLANVVSLCQRALPQGICESANNTLGPQPWSGERIGAACRGWEAAWKSRMLGGTGKATDSTLGRKGEEKEKLDAVAEAKARRHDETVDHKAEQAFIISKILWLPSPVGLYPAVMTPIGPVQLVV